MSKKGCAIVSVIVVVLLLILCGCGALCVALASSVSSFDTSTTASVQKEVIRKGSADKIVVIDINGMIMDVDAETGLFGTTAASSEEIIMFLDAAAEDDDVKAVVLNMVTPGGEVYASDLIYKKVVELQQQGIVVVTLMRSTAASGGYYIAAPTDKIVASEHTITGSIGVRADFQSLSGLYEKLGIETRTITNSDGDYKTGEGLFDDNPNGEEDEIYQDIVDEAFDRFVEIVAQGRDMEEIEVKKFADGRVFTGKQALEVGLVDQLGDLNTAITVAAKEAGISDPTVEQYTSYDMWSSLFGYVGALAKPEAKILEALEFEPGIKLYYLYSE